MPELVLLSMVVMVLGVGYWAYRRSAPPPSLGVERASAGRGRHVISTPLRVRASFTLRRMNAIATVLAQNLGEGDRLTGDGAFDAQLRLSTPRDDVHSVFCRDVALREALLRLVASEHKLHSLQVRKCRLCVTFKSGLMGWGRHAYDAQYAAVMGLRIPLEQALSRLPPDTAAQQRVQRMQAAALLIPCGLFLAAALAGLLQRPDISLEAVPLSWRLGLALPLLLIAWGVAFRATRNGRARLRAAQWSLILATGFLWMGAPEALAVFNASRVTEESTLAGSFQGLHSERHGKGGSRHWLRLVHEGQLMEFELSPRRHQALAAAGRWAPGQNVKVVLRQGRLGWHWVERIEGR